MENEVKIPTDAAIEAEGENINKLINEVSFKGRLDINDVSPFFEDAAKMLKETAMLMALKYLLNTTHNEERSEKEEWLRGIGKVIKWMESYKKV